MVEHARSNRAGCKLCKEKIDLNKLRIGFARGGPEGDPKYSGYGWHCVECLAAADSNSKDKSVKTVTAKVRRMNNYCG